MRENLGMGGGPGIGGRLPTGLHICRKPTHSSRLWGKMASAMASSGCKSAVMVCGTSVTSHSFIHNKPSKALSACEEGWMRGFAELHHGAWPRKKIAAPVVFRRGDARVAPPAQERLPPPCIKLRCNSSFHQRGRQRGRDDGIFWCAHLCPGRRRWRRRRLLRQWYRPCQVLAHPPTLLDLPDDTSGPAST